MKTDNLLKSHGQSLIEYAIILTLVALTIAGLLFVYGEEVVNLYQLVADLWPDH